MGGSITIEDKLGVSTVFNKYPRWQSIHRRGQCVRRREAGDGFTPGSTGWESVTLIFDNNRTF